MYRIILLFVFVGSFSSNCMQFSKEKSLLNPIFLLLFLGGSQSSNNNISLIPGSTVDLSGDGNPNGSGILIDSDGNGVADGIDITGDGTPNILLLDTNGDGLPDALDIVGDGVPDYYINPNPPPFLTTGPDGTGNPVVLILNEEGNVLGFDTDGDGTANDTRISIVLSDTTPPILHISPEGGVFATGQTVTLTCTDNQAPGNVIYTINGDPVGPSFPSNGTIIASPSGTVSFNTEGSHDLRARCRDLAGNLSNLVSQSYTVATEVANITVNSQSHTEVFSSGGGAVNVVFEWQSDLNGNYTIRISGSDCSTGDVAGGTNVTGIADATTPITTTVTNDSLVLGTNTIWFCVEKLSGNFDSTTRTVDKKGGSTLLSPETYSWGTFIDQQNGMVEFVGVAGTFGGNLYPAQTLVWSKCSHGQVYNPANNDCTGTGNVGNNYGAQTAQYCSSDDESCNDVVTKELNGTGASTLWDACNGLTLGGRTWRVPTINELKLLIHCTDESMPINGHFCEPDNVTSPSINILFPNTISTFYWSATSETSYLYYAWFVDFFEGNVNTGLKWGDTFVRCISGP